jgi:hypothetical protein
MVVPRRPKNLKKAQVRRQIIRDQKSMQQYLDRASASISIQQQCGALEVRTAWASVAREWKKQGVLTTC